MNIAAEVTEKKKSKFLGITMKTGAMMRASVIALLAFIFSIITIIGAGAQTVLYGFVLLLAGIPVYVWLKRTAPDSAQG